MIDPKYNDPNIKVFPMSFGEFKELFESDEDVYSLTDGMLDDYSEEEIRYFIDIEYHRINPADIRDLYNYSIVKKGTRVFTQ